MLNNWCLELNIFKNIIFTIGAVDRIAGWLNDAKKHHSLCMSETS